MNYLILAAAVSAGVSIGVWIILEFIPVLMPVEAGRLAAHLRSRPGNVIEVAYYLELLFEGSPWRRFMALEVVRDLFNSRIRELELLKYSRWKEEVESQKERMEMRELNDDEILHIEAAREMMDKNGVTGKGRRSRSLYPNREEEEFIRLRNHKRNMLLDLRDKYSDFRIWAIRNRDILKYVQERVFSNREIDLENLKSHSQEWALVNLWGLEPPEKYSEEDIFRDIIVYLQVTDDRKMRGKLAAALSDHEDAVTYLDEVISSVLSWKGGEGISESQ